MWGFIIPFIILVGVAIVFISSNNSPKRESFELSILNQVKSLRHKTDLKVLEDFTFRDIEDNVYTIDMLVITDRCAFSVLLFDLEGDIKGFEEENIWMNTRNKEELFMNNPLKTNLVYINALTETANLPEGLPIYNIIVFGYNVSKIDVMIKRNHQDVLRGYQVKGVIDTTLRQLNDARSFDVQEITNEVLSKKVSNRKQL